MSEWIPPLVLVGVGAFIAAALSWGLWLEKRDRVDQHAGSAPRHEVWCVIRGCQRHLWTVEDRVDIFATSRGWAKTPEGWVCDEHVRDIRAREYLRA